MSVKPVTPHKLSAVSLSRPAWVKRCWLRSFGPNLPGLASVREPETKTFAVRLLRIKCCRRCG